MNCKDIQQLIITDYMDDQMDREMKKTVDKHILNCNECKDFQFKISQAVIEPFDQLEKEFPPENIWENIRETIEGQYKPSFVETFLDNISSAFPIRKPVFAYSTVAVAMLLVIFTFFIPIKKQTMNDELAYIVEDIEYLALADVELNGDDDLGTSIEKYFL